MRDRGRRHADRPPSARRHDAAPSGSSAAPRWTESTSRCSTATARSSRTSAPARPIPIRRRLRRGCAKSSPTRRRPPGRSPNWSATSPTRMSRRSSAFSPKTLFRATSVAVGRACMARRCCIARTSATRGSFATARARRRRLGLDVVCDFRSADVAAGGEGAPLVPLYHAALAAGLERPLMFLNWGGVGNVTYLGPNGEIVAFDTGPANAPIDDFVRRRLGLSHDENGALAARGRVDARSARGLDARPLFPPPGAKVARPQPFSRADARRRGALGRRRRRDAGGLHHRGDGGGAGASSRSRRGAGWSAAAGAAMRR